MLKNDSNTLRERYRNCKDAKEKIRYTTLYAVSRGFSVAEAAKFVDVDESTVYDWIKKWVTEESVSDKPRSGRPQKLTEENEKEIKELIDENDPKKHRINAMSYTTAELHEYFLQPRGKDIDGETLRAHLRKMGAHFVKAQKRYKEADEENRLNFHGTSHMWQSIMDSRKFCLSTKCRCRLPRITAMDGRSTKGSLSTLLNAIK